MYPSDKKSKLHSASDVLQSLLQNGKSPLSGQYQRWRLWRFWPKIVGPTIAQNSQPVGYDNGKLIVWVSSSAHLQELRFMAGTLIKKINQSVGKKWVRQIIFTLDKRKVPQVSEADPSYKKFTQSKK